MLLTGRSRLIILGFDVGSHKIGVAVGQTLTKSAKPLQRIAAKNGLPEVTELKKLLANWHPDAIVVGIPLYKDNTQFTTGLVKKFVNFLKKITPLPIHIMDEKLTTKSARSDLFEQGGFKHLEKSDVDSYAAKLIIESWMNEVNID